MSKIKRLMQMKESLSFEEKKELLHGLQQMSIVEKQRLLRGLKSNSNQITEFQEDEKNVISKTFKVDGEFDSYVNSNRGVQFAPKEIDAIENFKDEKSPSAQDQFMVRFENSDAFGENSTVVIKKFKQGSQLIFTSFTKKDNINPEEPEPNPEGDPKPTGLPTGEPSKPTAQPAAAKMPSLKELLSETPSDQIIIRKSTVFNNEIDGADILADFLRQLNI